MISVNFQGKPFNIRVIQVYTPTSNAEEAEVEQFYEHLQDLLEKVSFHSNPKERQCQKCSNYRTVALISHASKVMLKILQARLQQYKN